MCADPKPLQHSGVKLVRCGLHDNREFPSPFLPCSRFAFSFSQLPVWLSGCQQVGYGDMFPVTPMGKLIGMCTVFSGLIILALPITVIGSKFGKVMSEMERVRLPAHTST